MKKLVIVPLIFTFNLLLGQNLSGIVINEDNKKPIEYVNIGIINKDIGTVSDLEGKYSISIDSQFQKDTIMFSKIGYFPKKMKVKNLKSNTKITLKEKDYLLEKVTIKPNLFEEKTLGVTTKTKLIAAGFKDNRLGYECGILMKTKKPTLLKEVNINISQCTYDTIYFRLNIYKEKGRKNFTNILKKPIYVKRSGDSIKESINVDLQSKNILVDNDFLVTLEHIKDLDEGGLYFCAGLFNKTYYRKTSQGEWETKPVGISVSVEAKIKQNVGENDL